MTLQALPAPIICGPPLPVILGSGLTTSIGGQNTYTFDAQDDGLAVIFQAQTTTCPDLVSFVVNAATVAGTAGDINATVQTVSNGTPSGTPVTNSATGTATISTTGVKTISGMAGTATLTVGEFYAVVIQAGAGWNRTLTISTHYGSNTQQGFPYLLTKNGAASWGSLAAGSVGWQMGIADSSGNYMYVPGCAGAMTAALQSFANSTNPDERGNRFVLSAPATCVGLQVWTAGLPGANDDFSIALYSDHTTSPVTLASKAIDGDNSAFAAGHTYLFNTPVDLSAGTVYAIAYKADGIETANIPRMDYASNAHLGGFFGTSFYSTTRNNGSGAFTDDNAKVYAIFPILSKIDDATGGAGGGGGPLIGGRLAA